jgi:hypothetical protein
MILPLLFAVAATGAPPPPVPVQLRIVETQMEIVTDTLSVRCDIENTSNDTVLVQAILDLPRAWIVGSRRAGAGPTPDQVSMESKLIEVPPNKHREIELGIPALRFQEEWPLVFYHARASRLTVRLKYQLNPGDFEVDQPTQHVTITPQAPYLGVLCGLFAGVLVFTTIVWLYVKTGQGKAIATGYWIKAGLSVASVIIASFALRYLGIAIVDLPVKFDVRDVYGGMALGFFCEPVVDWLGRLVANKPTTQSSGKAR